MMMLSLTSTLLLVDDDTDDADDADDANDANDADADDADDKRRRRSSIEEREGSRLDTSPDRAERLVVCCSSAPLAASQAEPIRDSYFNSLKIEIFLQTSKIK
jgi:hypothetical protein